MENSKKIKLSFEVFGDWLLGDTKWCVVCKETSMLIGCDTKKMAMHLKRNWWEWEFVDANSIRPNHVVTFFNKNGECDVEGSDDFQNQFNQDWNKNLPKNKNIILSIEDQLDHTNKNEELFIDSQK
tara:strand:+ start:3043 stop:3420 length:378 start_codon:yes stop_codon:yes gene_type:complete